MNIKNKLFFAPPPEHIKIAGYKLPTDPSSWKSEIIRYLKSSHPYLPLQGSRIELKKMDMAKGSAVGSIVLDGGSIAVPIIITRPRPGADPELAPLDVFFHKGKYQHLDPETIKQLTHKPEIGEPEGKKKGKATGGNPYIGDMTGDATPLEYSGQSSPFAGPFSGAKTAADISVDILPDWMLKEAVSAEAKENAAQGGALFGLAGGLRGAASGAAKAPSGLKAKLLGAISGGAKGAASGAAVGAVSGAATPLVRKALGISKKEKKRETAAIKSIVKTELNKESSFTVGIDAVVEHGHLANLVKLAFLDPNDVSNFRQMLATNPHALQGSASNLELIGMVTKHQAASARPSYHEVKNPNIVQIFKDQHGNTNIKFSGGPESRTDNEELKRIVGDKFSEIKSRLEAGNVFMEHDGIQQASWDAQKNFSAVKPITSDGLYMVRTKDGDSVTGMICTQMIDFDGKTLPMKLLVSPDGKYAIAGEMFGKKVSGKHRLPAQLPRGGESGVFVNYVHGTPIATLPMKIVSVSNIRFDSESDTRTIFIVQNPMTGEKFALSPVSGVQGFERMHVVSPGVKAMSDGAPIYYMPGDSEWVSLKRPVRVAENESEITKIASENDITHVVSSSGAMHVMSKNANKMDLSDAGAREELVGMGMDVDNAIKVVETARARPGMDQGVKIAGLNESAASGFEVLPKEPAKVATIRFCDGCRPGENLIKAASDTSHPETLDTILSLEFITPKNMKYFVDNIADFEEATSRLASLLVAVRLGLQHVPEAPVMEALEGLSKTVSKLKILKSASETKKNQ